MGTGPWRVDSCNQNGGAELSAFDGYWGGRPQIRRISTKYFLNETSAALAFRTGEIDLMPGVVNARSFEATSGATLGRDPDCAFGSLYLQSGVGPTSDVHVRRAIAYAIKPEDLIAARGGFAKPHYLIFPAALLYTFATKKDVDAMIKRLPQYRYNLAKAREELSKSAYPNGFKTEIVDGNPTEVRQAVIAMLKPLGIEAALTTDPTAARRLGPPNQRPNWMDNQPCLGPDPDFFSFFFEVKTDGTAGLFNWGNYVHRDVWELTQAAAAAPRTKRLALYEKLFKRVMTDLPYIPIWQQEAPFAISDRLTWPISKAASTNGWRGFGWQSYPFPLDIKPK
jgi:peptide/nickel transport system substrate-binding protein